MGEQVLDGRYELEQELGRGGMARVFLGTDRILHRQVAVKVLGAQYAADAGFVARFRREARAAAALNHPNVVGVFDTGSDDGTHYIVLEYIEGRTLSQVIREDGRLLPERAVDIADAVAGGLAFAHRAGVVHRDVKPGNIMLTPSGDVKVMDFGIARAVSAETITQTAMVLGTAAYISPEQAQGEPVDARSDLYSLGCVVYEMLCGVPPFTADTPVAVAYKHVREDPVPPSRLNPDVPADVDAVVVKLLAKNPDNRYQTAEEIQEDLRRIREDEPVSATPVLPIEPGEYLEREPRPTTVLPAPGTEESEGGRRWVAALVLLLILLLIGIGLFALAVSMLANDGALVRVPDVRGMALGVAEQRLEDAGFGSEVGNRVQSQEPAGTVVAYSPTEARRGDVITLTVSLGPNPQAVEVPDVVCLSEPEARRALEDSEFDVRVAGTAENPDCEPGTVARQDPDAGEELEQGKTVEILLVPEGSPSPSPSASSSPSPSPSPSESTTPSPSPSESTTPSPSPSDSPSPPPPPSPSSSQGGDGTPTPSPGS